MGVVDFGCVSECEREGELVCGVFEWCLYLNEIAGNLMPETSRTLETDSLNFCNCKVHITIRVDDVMSRRSAVSAKKSFISHPSTC